VSCDANGQLDTKRKKKEKKFKIFFILIFILFENYFNFYFNLKYFFIFENDMIEM